MTQTHSGGCFCGKTRYTLKTPPIWVQCCHCKDCQRQAGTAFVINALIETDRIDIEGAAPSPVHMKTESGRPHDIYRCDDCKTPLWSDYGGRPALRFVRVGTLDEPGALPPRAHIFTRSKIPWVVLPADQPAFDVYYEMETLWPAESLERRRVLNL